MPTTEELLEQILAELEAIRAEIQALKAAAPQPGEGDSPEQPTGEPEEASAEQRFRFTTDRPTGEAKVFEVQADQKKMFISDKSSGVVAVGDIVVQLPPPEIDGKPWKVAFPHEDAWYVKVVESEKGNQGVEGVLKKNRGELEQL
jgi:hypothetical protein